MKTIQKDGGDVRLGMGSDISKEEKNLICYYSKEISKLYKHRWIKDYMKMNKIRGHKNKKYISMCEYNKSVSIYNNICRNWEIIKRENKIKRVLGYSLVGLGSVLFILPLPVGLPVLAFGFGLLGLSVKSVKHNVKYYRNKRKWLR